MNQLSGNRNLRDNCGAINDRAQSSVVTFTLSLQLNILTGTFLSVSWSNTFKIYCGLCTVKAKNAIKNI